MEEYVNDRVADVSTYTNLFSPYASFANKTVLDLGCNEGYLLNGFLASENFEAIGAELLADNVERGRKAYGHKIRFIQTTPS